MPGENDNSMIKRASHNQHGVADVQTFRACKPLDPLRRIPDLSVIRAARTRNNVSIAHHLQQRELP